MKGITLFFTILCFFSIIVISKSSCSSSLFSKEEQMKIDEISDKLTRAVREKVNMDEIKTIHSDETKLVRLPDSPRYDGSEDNIELNYCKTGKDDNEVWNKMKSSGDPRKSKQKRKNSQTDNDNEDEYKRTALKPLCGRFIVDDFLTEKEADELREFAEFGMAIGGGAAGGVTLVDFVGSIVSHGAQFANLTVMANRHQSQVMRQRKAGLDSLQDLKDVIPTTGMLVWLKTIHKIHRLVQTVYDTKSSSCDLRYALPAFFSRIDPLPAQTFNDEYWHTHIDTEQYGSFDITTLLYLSSEQEDMSPEEFTDFLAGPAAHKLAKNHAPETKAEMKDRIINHKTGAKNTDIFRLEGVPDENEDEQIQQNANSHFQGGAFEFLSSRRDPENLENDNNHASNSPAQDENDPDVCHIGENAAESVKKIQQQGKTCKKKLSVHPKKGRLMLFSSGQEHPHRVEQVREGIRWTSTNAFTCDPKGKSIDVMKDEEFPPRWLAELAARAVLSSE